jgi:hypothetical protein
VRERTVILAWPDEPTPLQGLLLRAVTMPAEQAVVAWKQWAADVELDDLEPDSQWLLPLLFVRLRHAGVSPTAIERYANVFRHNWYKSQVRLRAVRTVIDELRRSGNEPVLLGGASLAVACYPVLGTRPFESLTIAAPQHLAVDQIRSAERCLRPEVGAVLRWRTARPAATRQVSIGGLTVSVPSVADALVQVVAGAEDGPHGEEVSDLLWAVDAVMVSRMLDRDGWDTVWRIAADHDLAATVEARLEWLRVVGLPIEWPTAA